MRKPKSFVLKTITSQTYLEIIQNKILDRFFSFLNEVSGTWSGTRAGGEQTQNQFVAEAYVQHHAGNGDGDGNSGGKEGGEGGIPLPTYLKFVKGPDPSVSNDWAS